MKGGSPGQRDNREASPTVEEGEVAGVTTPGEEPSDSLYPLWTPALLRFNQAILVSRHDPASRRRVVEEVRRRATSGGKWPQVGKRVFRPPRLLCAPEEASFSSRPLPPTSFWSLDCLFFFYPGTILS